MCVCVHVCKYMHACVNLLNCKLSLSFGEIGVFHVEHCNMKEVRVSAESKEPESFIGLLKENTLGVEW